jgi:A/G-specific adenine glycosylase
MTISRFRKLVWEHAKAHGRHALPWRAAKAGPYQVLVSEIMLQQTQVDRVVPFYQSFLKLFPNIAALAAAPLADVLRAWQGLGYNRRGKMLHDAAKALVRDHRGKVPRDVMALEALPGIGPYTARAVAAFAFDEDVIFIETNLRTAVIHHFFTGQEKVSDADVLAVLGKAFPQGQSRAWYAALMDYGAHLKRSGVRVNARSKGYARQKAFVGSDREARGAILKALALGPQPARKLAGLLGPERSPQLRRALSALLAEGMAVRRMGSYALPDANPRS